MIGGCIHKNILRISSVAGKTINTHCTQNVNVKNYLINLMLYSTFCLNKSISWNLTFSGNKDESNNQTA